MHHYFLSILCHDVPANALVIQLVQAVEDYTRALSMDPDLLAARNNRAACFVKLEKWSDALDDCNIVLKAEPDNAKALLRRAAARCVLCGGWYLVVLCMRYQWLSPKQQAASESGCTGGFGGGAAHPARQPRCTAHVERGGGRGGAVKPLPNPALVAIISLMIDDFPFLFPFLMRERILYVHSNSRMMRTPKMVLAAASLVLACMCSRATTSETRKYDRFDTNYGLVESYVIEDNGLEAIGISFPAAWTASSTLASVRHL